MNYVIDEVICNKKGMELPTLLAILLVKTGVDIPQLFANLEAKQVLVKDLFEGGYLVTQRWDSVASDILLSADSNVPKESRLDSLAESLMELYPKGKKEGTSVYWRGNKKDTKERLQKFFKLYGDKFTDEQIIEATSNYVRSFNSNYSLMRVLKYFIWKDVKKINSDGIGYIEEVSDLATLIENNGAESEREDWTSTLR